MKPNELIVRCFAERRADGVWQAFSIELGLAAQADSFPEVKQKLEAQIADYVYEALTIDRAHADELLSRQASLQIRLKYMKLRMQLRMHQLKSGVACLFEEVLPMEPRAAA